MTKSLGPPKLSLLEMLASLAPIDEEFPLIEDPPPEPVELDFGVDEEEET